MSRAIRHLGVFGIGALVCMAAAGEVQGQDQEVQGQEQEVQDSEEQLPSHTDSQEIGAIIGVGLGGGLSPGGAALGGRYLYRLSDQDWFAIAAEFRLGSGGAECFRDRQGETVCDHGLVDGFASHLDASIRRYFSGQEQFRPFAAAGVGLALQSFSDDGLLGLGIPLHIQGGVRATVAHRVHVVVDATLRGGASLFNKEVGLAPHLGLTLAAGVEFTLEDL